MSSEPLVSIVIPTYQRPEYFAMALESVLAQTYKKLDIFITDNSHNEDTKNIVQKYLGMNGYIMSIIRILMLWATGRGLLIIMTRRPNM